MRLAPFVCLALGVASPASAQMLKPEALMGPNHTVTDADYGVALTCPEGWQLRNAFRWGDLETTLNFSTEAVTEASLNLYYRVFTVPFAPAEGVEAWLRTEAGRKEKERSLSDRYKNYANRAESFVASAIADSAALSWSADFTRNGQRWTECLADIAGVHGRASFSLSAPAEKLAALRPTFDAMVASARLTAGAVVQRADPRVVEARRLYLAQEFQKSADVFVEALRDAKPTPADLVVAAGAAARVANQALAFSWLHQAIAAGRNNNLRLIGNQDFVSLNDTDEWKKLISKLPGAQQTLLPSRVTDQPLQEKLLAILEEDQKYRLKVDAVEKEFGRNSEPMRNLWKQMAEADAANLPQITAILDERGWVGPDVVGSEANSALFLVIQHADIATQEKYLPLMREAVKAKRARGSSLALLEDRVALRQGRPQTYGSQIGRDNASGDYYVQALADPDHVDERRDGVGLPPLADYVENWKIKWDVEAYKKQLPALEAKLQKPPPAANAK